jgi:hypothetical protein
MACIGNTCQILPFQGNPCDTMCMTVGENRFPASSQSFTLHLLTATQALGQNYPELASIRAGTPGRAPNTVFAQGRPGQHPGERLRLTVGPTRETRQRNDTFTPDGRLTQSGLAL